jgi:hypothetical protein
VVERRRGLVDEQHRRFGEERAGDVDALAFAAGELVRTAALLRGARPTAARSSDALVPDLWEPRDRSPRSSASTAGRPRCRPPSRLG